MSTLTVDNPHFDYPAGAYPRAGRCHVRVYDQGAGECVVVLTDLGDENPGASVTNAVETIVTTAVRRYALDPIRLTVVEHYDDRLTREVDGGPRRRTEAELARLIGRAGGESFDVVTFSHVPTARTATAVVAAGAGPGAGTDVDPLAGDEFAGPAWRRISKRQAEALVGQPLP